MMDLFESYKSRIIGATLGMLFHLGLIGIVMGGEGQIFLILILMYFPITLIWNLFFGVVGAGGTAVVGTFFIGGTLMYAGLGWCAGTLLEKCFDYHSHPFDRKKQLHLRNENQ